MNVMDEMEAGIDALESSDEFEWIAGQQEWTGEAYDGEAVFDEVEEMELAAALLEVDSEQELEEFIGKLVKKAGRAFRNFARSGVGRAIGGVLKGVARTALPIAGKVLGNMVVPGIGGMVGGKLASAAGKMFGLELEGLSPQDQEFEIARRFVRLSGAAVRQAAVLPPQGSPVNRAKDAVLAAAREHAPGLVRSGGAQGELFGGPYGGPAGGRARPRPGWRGRPPARPSRTGFQRRRSPRGGLLYPRSIHVGDGPCDCDACRGADAWSQGRGTWVRRGDVVILRTES